MMRAVLVAVTASLASAALLPESAALVPAAQLSFMGGIENVLCFYTQWFSGAVLLRDKKCCLGNAVDHSYVCPYDGGINANLTYVDYQPVAGDCVWKQPTVIIAARTTRDVSNAVRLLSYYGIKFTTRCGAHSESCASTCHNCGVISTLYMKSAEVVTPPGSTHTYMDAQAGISVSDAVLTYKGTGFMFPHGGFSSICISGHFLGGGMGSMTRKYGYTSDHVVGVEVVLTGGKVIRVFDDDHEGNLHGYALPLSDPKDKRLLWILKGSGHAGFGIVTRMWLRLNPQPKYVVSGSVRYGMYSPNDAHLLFNASCNYFREAFDDTEETSRLQVWSRILPLVDQQTPTVQYGMTYVPEDVTDEASALAEAMTEFNLFTSVTTATPIEATFTVKTYDELYAGSIAGGSTLGMEGTCSSKVIMKKQDVCDNPEWLDSMAQRVWEMVQPVNWLAKQEVPYLAIEKWGGAAYYNDPHHLKSTMSTRDAWTAFEYCRWRLNPADPWTNIQDDVRDFNDEHLLPISHVYYKNYADYMVTDVRDLYPDPYIFHNARLLKQEYDPTEIFSKDDGEPSLL
ncbi:6-hydroxy-D-nicotine oxidase [Diplonema papillatum]|nr:6-hydroxy-D-nicotine oxidase [Diplonema papillatum]